ncbi:hypothetical protein [Streptomyces sp. Ac-502]|uniref:hypothetical protein n=1 Tax=Streptomyces sp. Ac-502 TaxID=3342801 RepID=UPI00386290B8
MQFEPTDVVVRICLNTAGAESASAAMRISLPLIEELDPRAVQFEEADPDGLRRGYLVELLLVLPCVETERPDTRLTTTVRPLVRRLGLDDEKFTVDDATGTSGDVSANEREWQNGRTACGTYALYAQIGADPMDPPAGGPEEADEDDEDLDLDTDDQDSVPPFTAGELAEMSGLVQDLTSLQVSFTAEIEGLDETAARSAVSELVEQWRPLAGDFVVDTLSADEHSTLVLGGHSGPTAWDTDSPTAALTAFVEQLDQRFRGPVTTTETGAGPFATMSWSAPESERQGLTRLEIHAGTGLVRAAMASGS